MDIQKVQEIIHKIADGFEDNALQCLANQSDVVVRAITEQLYCGQNGDGEHLSPTYLNDDFFIKYNWHHVSEETGKEYFGARGYMEWKKDITPPESSEMLGLPPRPEDVPNLYIYGTFHRDISATLVDDGLRISPGNNDGPAIVMKYGDSILNMGPTAIEYFNANYLWPAIENFYKDCGYK